MNTPSSRPLSLIAALAALLASVTPAAARLGYDVGDPIRTTSVPGEYRYLARLRGPDGAEVSARRYGSTFVAGFDAPMDVWRLAYGTNAVDVYVYGYGPTNSLAAPEGFSLLPEDDPGLVEPPRNTSFAIDPDGGGAIALFEGEAPAPAGPEPAPGEWPGLGSEAALAAWSESVRTNENLFTSARFRDGQLLPLLRREALEPLLAGPDGDAAWIDEAKGYVERELWFCWFSSMLNRPNPDWGRAYDFTVKEGSKDPFLSWMSIVGQHKWHWDDGARKQLAGLEEDAAAGTPFQRLLAAHARDLLDPSDETKAALRAAAVAWAESRAAHPEDSRAVRKVLLTFFGEGDAALAEALEGSAADPWIGLLFRGKAEIDAAWQSRGSGWASTVTADGWKGFSEHQEKAAEALERAHELHPEFPNAAAYMVKVSGASCDGNLDLWFGRAIAAQADSAYAWNQYYWHNLPRWGGSVARIRRLAKAALATERPEVAFWYGPLMAVARSESDADPGTFWAAPGVAENMEKALAPSLEGDGADFWTRRVAGGILGPLRFRRGDLEGAIAANAARDDRTASFAHEAFPDWMDDITVLDGLGGPNAALVAPLYRKYLAKDWAACAAEADAVWDAARGLQPGEASLLSTIASAAWTEAGYAAGEPRRFGMLRKRQFVDWLNYDSGFTLEEGTDEGSGHSRDGKPHWLRLRNDVPAALDVAGSFEPWGSADAPHVLLVRVGAGGNSWGQDPESPSVVFVREKDRVGVSILPDVGVALEETEEDGVPAAWRHLPEGWPVRYRIVFAAGGVLVFLGDDDKPFATGAGWRDDDGALVDPDALPERVGLWFGHRNARFLGIALRKPSDGDAASAAELAAAARKAAEEEAAAGDPVLLNERAWELYLAGRAEEALPFAQKAAERSDWRTFPLNVAARDTLACVQCALGRTDEAKETLAEAFKSLLSGRFMVARNGDDDESADAERIMQFHLAQIYDRAGETDLARATLEVVIRAGFLPDSPEEERAFAALARKLGLAPPPAAP